MAGWARRAVTSSGAGERILGTVLAGCRARVAERPGAARFTPAAVEVLTSPAAGEAAVPGPIGSAKELAPVGGVNIDSEAYNSAAATILAARASPTNAICLKKSIERERD